VQLRARCACALVCSACSVAGRGVAFVHREARSGRSRRAAGSGRCRRDGRHRPHMEQWCTFGVASGFKTKIDTEMKALIDADG
jgi:hypothetical protein